MDRTKMIARKTTQPNNPMIDSGAKRKNGLAKRNSSALPSVSELGVKDKDRKNSMLLP